MSTESNYTVAPHLAHFAVPFPTFRAANPEFKYFIGGGLIFSRTAKNKNQDSKNDQEPKGELRMLLLQRSFEDSFGGAWEGPGGSCDPEDKTLLDGVAREVLEESGLHVSRFVDLASRDEWVKRGPGSVAMAVKHTFIVEVHEASDSKGSQSSEGQDGLQRSWEDMVKLDPAEHRAFEWVTEEEIRESIGDLPGRLKSFRNGEKAMLEAFQMLNST